MWVAMGMMIIGVVFWLLVIMEFFGLMLTIFGFIRMGKLKRQQQKPKTNNYVMIIAGLALMILPPVPIIIFIFGL